MICLQCSNELSDIETRMAQTIVVAGRIIEKCTKCITKFVTVDASVIERYARYLERNRFKCRGCLANVKRKYEDEERRNFCVRCTRGTSRSRLDLYSEDTERWPIGHIEDVDRSPVAPSQEILTRQDEVDEKRWEREGVETVNVDPEVLAELLEKPDKIQESKANARNKQISKRMWGG